MGLEDLIDVTDDIGAADAILATSYEIRQNPWIHGVAKFHQSPVFVIKVPYCCLFNCSFSIFSFCLLMNFCFLQSNTMAQMVKAVRMILGLESFGPTPKKPFNGSLDIEIEDDEPKRKPSLEEIDALEVKSLSIYLISI